MFVRDLNIKHSKQESKIIFQVNTEIYRKLAALRTQQLVFHKSKRIQTFYRSRSGYFIEQKKKNISLMKTCWFHAYECL